jgi:hypothetical protein
MVLYATPSAKLVSMALVPSAGRTAPMTLASVTMAPTAISLRPTAVVLVRSTSAKAAISGALSGTLHAMRTSIM